MFCLSVSCKTIYLCNVNSFIFVLCKRIYTWVMQAYIDWCCENLYILGSCQLIYICVANTCTYMGHVNVDVFCVMLT